MRMRTYTTTEAAKKAGVSRQTLHAWITQELIAAPASVRMGKRRIRFWTEQDIAVLKKFKGSLQPGPKRGRKS
jgi:excisionase family DNA binding protein